MFVFWIYLDFSNLYKLVINFRMNGFYEGSRSTKMSNEGGLSVDYQLGMENTSQGFLLFLNKSGVKYFDCLGTIILVRLYYIFPLNTRLD